MTPSQNTPTTRVRSSFGEDFRRFFTRGLAVLMPTLVTVAVVLYVLDLLWEYVGKHLLNGVRYTWLYLGRWGFVDERPAGYIGRALADEHFLTRVLGVVLAILAIYVLGLFIGNLIGRSFLRLGEAMLLKIPIIKAIYGPVKQVTEFLLADNTERFSGSRVVAVRPHESNIWSIGLVTGPAPPELQKTTGEPMVSVFIPSSPTAFSGYLLVVPRSQMVDLPLKVEEAMRLLVSGGVVLPPSMKPPGMKPPGMKSRGMKPVAGGDEPLGRPAGPPAVEADAATAKPVDAKPPT
ncbi:MAG: DUF502 domain-containing protein [Phycisphaerae bacterium]